MKRRDNFKYELATKKSKLEQDFDDIWGDDPEIDEVDRCINLATQICSQKANNHDSDFLNFGTYTDFKNKQKHTSTQVFFPIPSTSGVSKKVKNSNLNSVIVTQDAAAEELSKSLQRIKILESDKQKLTELCETKNGEISILRSQLKQSQKTVDNEKSERLKTLQESQQKWDTKLSGLSKEISGLKCELDLKNLEIANFKNKIFELKKTCNLNVTLCNDELNTSFIPKNRVSNIQETDKICKSIQTEIRKNIYFTPVSYLPIENIPKTVFQRCQEENCVEKFSTNKNRLICINNISPDIFKLTQFSNDEINSNYAFNTINKILNLTRNNLLWLSNDLKRMKENINIDQIQNNETKQYFSNCIFSGTLWHEKELASDIRRYLAVLSTLSLHSDQIYECFTTPQILNDVPFHFLDLIFEVMVVIRSIGKSEQYCGLLAAILKLLGLLSFKRILSKECYEQFFLIFKQIIFSQLNNCVLKYVCEFLQYISFHEQFIEKLCTVKKIEIAKPSIKDGLSQFSEDSCTFKILVTQLESCKLNAEMACSLTQFLGNIISYNVFWMYPQEKRCECLIRMYSLAIDILYNTCKNFDILNREIEDKRTIQSYYTIFHVGLIFFNNITARIPDLIIRCTSLYPQYYCIIKYIGTNRNRLFLKEIHECALDHLVSQFPCDEQKQCKTTDNIDYIFNNYFTSV